MAKIGQNDQSGNGEWDVRLLMKVDLSTPAPAPEYLIESIVPEDLSALYGDGGVAKTILALAEATCIALGRPYLGHQTKCGPVLYIDFEMGAAAINYRAFQVALGMGLDRPPAGLHVFTINGKIANAWDEIRMAIAQYEPLCIYIDSLGAALGDEDAIAAKVINPLMSKLQALAVPVRLVDHQANLQKGEHYSDKKEFGSAYKRHRIRASWQVERANVQPERGLLGMLHHKKVNFGPLRTEPIGVHLTFDGDAVVISPQDVVDEPGLLEKLQAQDRTLLLVRSKPGITRGAIVEQAGITETTVLKHLKTLERLGQIRHEEGEHHNAPWRYFPAREMHHQPEGEGAEVPLYRGAPPAPPHTSSGSAPPCTTDAPLDAPLDSGREKSEKSSPEKEEERRRGRTTENVDGERPYDELLGDEREYRRYRAETRTEEAEAALLIECMSGCGRWLAKGIACACWEDEQVPRVRVPIKLQFREGGAR